MYVFLKCKDNNIWLLYKTTIQSSCFNFGRMLSCQSQTYNVLFKQQPFVTTAPFSDKFMGIITFALWGQAESHCHALCLLSNNTTANTPLVKKISAPVPPMYSGNDRKCIATYLSKANPLPSTGMGDRGYK